MRHCWDFPQLLRAAVICAVPRARARNVRGGSVHVVPGRHTIDIGDIPGARIDGLVDDGAVGNGNWDAITSVPTATWKVIPFCAGVTVIVPCPTLGGDVFGGLGRDGEEGAVVRGAEEDADVGCPEAEPEELEELEGLEEPEAPELVPTPPP